jgi:hypothetical protein
MFYYLEYVLDEDIIIIDYLLTYVVYKLQATYMVGQEN